MQLIRPGIITILALVVSIGFFIGKIEAQVYVPFATGLIVYWFKSRDNER